MTLERTPIHPTPFPPAALPARGGRPLALVLLLPAAIAQLAGQAQAQTAQTADPALQIQVNAVESANASDTSGQGERMQDSLEVSPIQGDAAAMDASAAAEVALNSEEDLRAIPEAWLIRLAAGATYNDNIFQTESAEESDLILQYGLGATLQSTKGGNTAFAFNYDATAFNYLDHPEVDGLNHSVGLQLGLSLPKTTLGLSASYNRVESGDQLPRRPFHVTDSNLPEDEAANAADQRVSQGNREAGLFNTRDIITAALTASHSLAPKTHLVSSLGYASNLYEDEQYQSTRNVTGQLGLTYQFTGKTTLGLAGSAGYQDNDGNGTQVYQSALLTATCNASGKLTFKGAAGIEFRQYGEPDPAETDSSPTRQATAEREDSTKFVFNLGAAYQLRPRTSLTLSASQGSDGSALVGVSSVERTNLALGIDQAIGQRFKLGLAGGYELADYTPAGGSDSPATAALAGSRGTDYYDRLEKYWFGRASLNFTPTPRSSIGLFYELRNNDSDGGGLTYESNRVGVQCAINF